ncbi:ABC transporter permease [Corynebacterium guangdongense]|uniref:Osmoprotectant transport system permease protein n=1 Tax=Corynebacterium guangdongense TaxID=1783348 RepID=A0ABU1ZXN9_9CORY|nr:ABC transporter permease [Corynebacterium guangdongense]MDR7329681.1 osmoprotectant transport system permease protein [Corynebacterium guangdongense]WJZ18245.1 Choline transport system permease protein OpuBB [Corynebacterium guangdongense]
MNVEWLLANVDQIGRLALTHANLSWPAVLASTLIALPIGWVAHRYAWGRDALVGLASVLYAIPSLVLFILMPLVLGTSIISPLNVLVALTIYGVALQVRTVADGFDAVDATQRNTATALGYTSLRRVLGVELPLAAPVIVGGIRVVSASTISLVSVGALIGVQSLGSLFTNGFLRSFPTEILAGIIGTVILALLFDALIVAAAWLLLPWTRARRTR